MAHTYSSRTQVLADGTIGAWLVVDGSETWIGFFTDVFLAQRAADIQIESLTAGNP
jgi:hypothetical protein